MAPLEGVEGGIILTWPVYIPVISSSILPFGPVSLGTPPPAGPQPVGRHTMFFTISHCIAVQTHTCVGLLSAMTPSIFLSGKKP